MSDVESLPSPSDPHPAAPRRPITRSDSGVSLGGKDFKGLSSLSDDEQGVARTKSRATTSDTDYASSDEEDLSLGRANLAGGKVDRAPREEEEPRSPLDTGSLVVLTEAHIKPTKGDPEASLVAKLSRTAEKMAALGIATLPAGWAFLVTVGRIYDEVGIFLE